MRGKREESPRGGMRVEEARRQAAEWVAGEASRTPGFLGAFLTGSLKWKSPESLHPASSDVDVRVVVEGAQAPPGRPKSPYREILLEAAFVSREDLGTADQILADPFRSGGLWQPVWLAEPSDALAALARRVSSEFARRSWVDVRRASVMDLVRRWLRRVGEAPSFGEQATCFLFGTSATTLPLLAAGLRNLTVKRRHAESRALLAEHERLEFHEEMLDWLGCVDLTLARAREHLRALEAAFDVTAEHVDASYRFAADLRPAARVVAIDGCRELIESGLHRESVFWMGATFSRCMAGQRRDAPAVVQEVAETGFHDLLRDLDVRVGADLAPRVDRVRACLPRLESVAAEIADATPEILD